MRPTTNVIIRSTVLLLLFVLAAWLSATTFFDSPAAIIRGPVLFGDPQRELTPQQVIQHAANAPEHAPSIPPSIGSYWWLAEVSNPTDKTTWVVHLGNTAIERAELYVFNDQEVIQHTAVDLLALNQDATPDYVIGHHLPLTLAPDSKRTVLLRLETPVAHPGLIFIKPAAVASNEAHFHMVAIWTGAGAMVALICYNLFLGFSLRLSTYLYYVGHASGHLLYMLTALGILGAGLPVLERYLLLNIPAIGIAVLCGALFIYHFLDLPTLAPRLARIYRVFIGAVLASPLLLLVLEPHTFFTITRGNHLLLALLVLSAALIGVHRKKREARYIVIGWGGMLALTTKGMLGVMGITALSIDAGVWGLWAILFEMFFLSLALADRVRRLSREKEAAQAANAAKSTFLATMSHEIRTPLNGVLGMVDVLRATPLDARQRQYLDHIGKSGTALLSLLDDILDYSRVEAGRIKLEHNDFEPRRMLEELVFLLSTQAEKKGLQLQLTIDPNLPPTLRGDAGRLRQVLLNLLGNAVKFTEQGSVHLTVECVAQQGSDHQLRFTVGDTGIGMDPEVLEHLFDRFHQADSSIARRYGGSGLGLAIAHELVQLMGGKITVNSQAGHGSRFQVELTLPAGTPLPQTDSDDTPITLPPLNILVVDDDAINRLVASNLLANDGHQVATADSGAAALASVTETAFDLVLMDLGMPGMDGLEVTRHLRARGVAIPVVGLTAHVLPEQQAACINAGMNAVIHKPVQLDKLKRLLAAVLQHNHSAPAPSTTTA